MVNPLMLIRFVLFLLSSVWSCTAFSSGVATLILREDIHEYQISEHIELLRDADNHIQISDLLQSDGAHEWLVHQGESPAFGYTGDAVWMKRTLSRLSEANGQSYFLQVFYSMLDEVVVYFVQNGQVVNSYESGDTRPFFERAVQHRNFVFPVSLSTDAETTVYIRIKTEGSLRLTATIWSAKGIFESEQILMGWQGIFVGALVIMLFYNLALALFMRDRTYFYYVVFIVVELLVLLQFKGLNYQFLWPDLVLWNEKALPFLVGCLLASAALFVGSFLGLKKSYPIHHRMVLVFIATGFAISLATFLIPYTVIIRVASVCVAIGVSYAIGLCCYLLYRGHRAARFVVLSWFVLLVAALLFILNANGYMPPSFFIENAVQLGSMLEIALLSLAFADRINIERKAKQMAQMALVEIQKQANAELEQKVQERTNELELVNAKLKEMNTIDALTGVKNRGFFNANIEKEFKVSSRAQSTLVLIMIDIDHFKSINDTYGHQVGDQALIHISALIKTVVRRPNDAISRYGGEEFAILLPHTNAEGARAVAERIRVVIEQNPLKIESGDLAITASLGYCVTSAAETGGYDQLIERADIALYQAKSAGRNKVVAYRDPDSN